MAETQAQPETTQNRQRKARNRQLSSTQVMFAVVLAVALMLAVQFSARIADERNLNAIRDTIQEEIDLLRTEQTDLIDELDYVQSDAYVAEWARREGRMVLENMVLVIPVPASGAVQVPVQEAVTTAESGTVETTLPDPVPWQLWWALFFDMPPPAFTG